MNLLHHSKALTTPVTYNLAKPGLVSYLSAIFAPNLYGTRSMYFSVHLAGVPQASGETSSSVETATYQYQINSFREYVG